MKNLKLLLLGLLTPLLCGVSFGYNRFENLSAFQDLSIDSSDDYIIREPDTTYCIYVSGLNSSRSNSFYINNDSWGGCNTLVNSVSAGITDYNYCFQVFSCNDLEMGGEGMRITAPDLNLPMKVYKFNSSNTPINIVSDCSSVENQLNQCQSDLSTCQNDGSHCDTLYGKCVEDYSGCQSDLSSLENYNQSLTDQLNECLNNSVASGDDANSGNCLTNSLFWFDNDNMFSLPITNNLFLPNGYQGYVNSGNVLGISDIENNTVVYEFDQESKENTINSMSIIMLFLVATGFIMFVIKFLKKLFFKS